MSIFKDKTLLITGGTGSFGNAVLNRFLRTDIGEIRIFSRDEKKQDDMRHEYQVKFPDVAHKIKFFIGDVRNLQSCRNAMPGVDYIFHAAALKQVPSCEFFPMEAVKTNVIGTDNVLTAAIEAGVGAVICLSTDKAAYPINAMGITKAIEEKIAVAKSRYSGKTKICCTRYGNVMCSRGSVIPLWIEQIRGGNPITLTEPKMTRFIMSLEEAGIPIDYVAGTSMGALVGALYAIGYSPNEIDSLVALQDWQLLLSDKVKRDNLTFPEKENSEKYVITLPFGFDKKDRMIDGMVKGQSLQNLFSNLTIGYHDSVDFRSFPIPFSCVAVNIVDGKDYVFQKGSLPVAMRASMAIPAVFTPVKLDSMVLVDGGLNNNYPADVAKEMGADIIIGVDLGSSDLKERQNLNSSVGIVSQIVALHGYEKYQRNLKVTDLLIRPDLHPYNSTSFTASAIDTMIIRGEEATRKAWPTLMELKKEIGITDSVVPISKRIHLSNRANSFLIRNIHFEGADPHDEKWLLKICKLKENSYITLEQLHHAMAVLVETNAYSNVSYKLIGEESKDLYLIVAPKSASSITSLKSLEPTS